MKWVSHRKRLYGDVIVKSMQGRVVANVAMPSGGPISLEPACLMLTGLQNFLPINLQLIRCLLHQC